MTWRTVANFLFSFIFCAALLFIQTPVDAQEIQTVDADVLLVGGTLIDGTGSPGVIGDVAIRDDRIVAVGQFKTGRIGRTISCEGQIVAPGFIDLHNHSDFATETISPKSGQKLRRPAILIEQTRPAKCYLTQGCTTIVTGNCGGGALNVENYYSKLDDNPPGVNVAHLLPHGALRELIVGLSRRAPKPEELEKMRKLASKAMRAGAWGMSTGLQYVPGSFADIEELGVIAREVGQWGGIYASHMRDEGDQLLEAVTEAIEIGRRGKLPVHISHFKASKRRNWGKVRAAAKLIEQKRAAGQRVTVDQYPYIASSTTITAMLLPDEEREGGSEAVVQKFNDPEQLKRLTPIVQEALDARSKIMIASCPKHPDWVGKTIREVAAAENRPPLEVAFDIIRSGEEQGVNFSMDPRDVRFVMTLPWAATASDGSTKVDDGTRPHPRSFGTFSRRIGRLAIEEGVVSVEKAVRSATGLPADILGLQERGYLKPGNFADVVVFDPQTYRDQATFQSPFELSTGVQWVFVNGKAAIESGKLSVLDAGRALRKPQE